jgi:hypothetical protein
MMKEKLKILFFTFVVFFVFLIGSAANIWSTAEFVAWSLFVMSSIKLVSALKSGVYITYRVRAAPALKIEERETRWVFWVVLGAEFCLWVFSIWLCYLVASHK